MRWLASGSELTTTGVFELAADLTGDCGAKRGCVGADRRVGDAAKQIFRREESAELKLAISELRVGARGQRTVTTKLSQERPFTAQTRMTRSVIDVL